MVQYVRLKNSRLPPSSSFKRPVTEGRRKAKNGKRGAGGGELCEKKKKPKRVHCSVCKYSV